jgi:glycopeptide antibiotics resistance protein
MSVEVKPLRRGGHVLVVLFVVYLVLLAWTVLWKLDAPYIGAAALLPRPIKLIPFLPSAEAGGSAPIEIVGNFLLFVPFGAYLGLLAPTWPWWKWTGVLVGASFVLETTQHVLSIGSFDTTDIIVNTAGGLAGLGLLALARRSLQARTVAVMTRVCLIGTVVSLLAVGIFVASPVHYRPQHDVIFSTPSVTASVVPSPDSSGQAAWSFSGSGSEKTASFAVHGPLRVEYTFVGSGSFVAVLRDSSGVAVANIADRTGPGHLSTWVYGAAGDVYLDVTSRDPWTIAVTMIEPPVAKVPVRLAGTTNDTTAPIAFLGAEAIAWTHEGTGAFRIVAIDPVGGSTVEPLVDTVGPGSKTFAFGSRGTYALGVSADGAWTVSIKPGD